MAEQWLAGEDSGSQRAHLPQELQPEPELQPELQPKPSQGDNKAGWIVTALVGVALLGGVGYFTGVFPNAAPKPATVTSTAPAQPQGFSLLQPVQPGDRAVALQSLMMSDVDKGKVSKAVEKGSARLAWLALSDSGKEDGDIVTISGAGFSQTVPLLKKQTRVAVAYTPGTPIRVYATKDGFSPGVTVAVYVGGNVFNLKTMKEGETIEIASP